eukprot:g1463.t1
MVVLNIVLPAVIIPLSIFLSLMIAFALEDREYISFPSWWWKFEQEADHLKGEEAENEEDENWRKTKTWRDRYWIRFVAFWYCYYKNGSFPADRGAIELLEQAHELRDEASTERRVALVAARPAAMQLRRLSVFDEYADALFMAKLEVGSTLCGEPTDRASRRHLSLMAGEGKDRETRDEARSTLHRLELYGQSRLVAMTESSVGVENTKLTPGMLKEKQKAIAATNKATMMRWLRNFDSTKKWLSIVTHQGIEKNNVEWQLKHCKPLNYNFTDPNDPAFQTVEEFAVHKRKLDDAAEEKAFSDRTGKRGAAAGGGDINMGGGTTKGLFNQRIPAVQKLDHKKDWDRKDIYWGESRPSADGNEYGEGKKEGEGAGDDSSPGGGAGGSTTDGGGEAPGKVVPIEALMFKSIAGKEHTKCPRHVIDVLADATGKERMITYSNLPLPPQIFCAFEVKIQSVEYNRDLIKGIKSRLSARMTMLFTAVRMKGKLAKIRDRLAREKAAAMADARVAKAKALGKGKAKGKAFGKANAGGAFEGKHKNAMTSGAAALPVSGRMPEFLPTIFEGDNRKVDAETSMERLPKLLDLETSSSSSSSSTEEAKNGRRVANGALGLFDEEDGPKADLDVIPQNNGKASNVNNDVDPSEFLSYRGVQDLRPYVEELERAYSRDDYELMLHDDVTRKIVMDRILEHKTSCDAAENTSRNLTQMQPFNSCCPPPRPAAGGASSWRVQVDPAQEQEDVFCEDVLPLYNRADEVEDERQSGGIANLMSSAAQSLQAIQTDVEHLEGSHRMSATGSEAGSKKGVGPSSERGGSGSNKAPSETGSNKAGGKNAAALLMKKSLVGAQGDKIVTRSRSNLSELSGDKGEDAAAKAGGAKLLGAFGMGGKQKGKKATGMNAVSKLFGLPTKDPEEEASPNKQHGGRMSDDNLGKAKKDEAGVPHVDLPPFVIGLGARPLGFRSLPQPVEPGAKTPIEPKFLHKIANSLRDFSEGKMPGHFPVSMGFGSDGLIHVQESIGDRSKKYYKTKNGQLRQGDVLTVLMDRAKGHIFFFRNGKIVEIEQQVSDQAWADLLDPEPAPDDYMPLYEDGLQTKMKELAGQKREAEWKQVFWEQTAESRLQEANRKQKEREAAEDKRIDAAVKALAEKEAARMRNRDGEGGFLIGFFKRQLGISNKIKPGSAPPAVEEQAPTREGDEATAGGGDAGTAAAPTNSGSPSGTASHSVAATNSVSPSGTSAATASPFGRSSMSMNTVESSVRVSSTQSSSKENVSRQISPTNTNVTSGSGPPQPGSPMQVRSRSSSRLSDGAHKMPEQDDGSRLRPDPPDPRDNGPAVNFERNDFDPDEEVPMDEQEARRSEEQVDISGTTGTPALETSGDSGASPTSKAERRVTFGGSSSTRGSELDLSLEAREGGGRAVRLPSMVSEAGEDEDALKYSLLQRSWRRISGVGSALSATFHSSSEDDDKDDEDDDELNRFQRAKKKTARVVRRVSSSLSSIARYLRRVETENAGDDDQQVLYDDGNTTQDPSRKKLSKRSSTLEMLAAWGVSGSFYAQDDNGEDEDDDPDGRPRARKLGIFESVKTTLKRYGRIFYIAGRYLVQRRQEDKDELNMLRNPQKEERRRAEKEQAQKEKEERQRKAEEGVFTEGELLALDSAALQRRRAQRDLDLVTEIESKLQQTVGRQTRYHVRMPSMMLTDPRDFAHYIILACEEAALRFDVNCGTMPFAVREDALKWMTELQKYGNYQPPPGAEPKKPNMSRTDSMESTEQLAEDADAAARDVIPLYRSEVAPYHIEMDTKAVVETAEKEARQLGKVKRDEADLERKLQLSELIELIFRDTYDESTGSQTALKRASAAADKLNEQNRMPFGQDTLFEERGAFATRTKTARTLDAIALFQEEVRPVTFVDTETSDAQKWQDINEIRGRGRRTQKKFQYALMKAKRPFRRVLVGKTEEEKLAEVQKQDGVDVLLEDVESNLVAKFYYYYKALERIRLPRMSDRILAGAMKEDENYGEWIAKAKKREEDVFIITHKLDNMIVDTRKQETGAREALLVIDAMMEESKARKEQFTLTYLLKLASLKTYFDFPGGVTRETRLLRDHVLRHYSHCAPYVLHQLVSRRDVVMLEKWAHGKTYSAWTFGRLLPWGSFGLGISMHKGFLDVLLQTHKKGDRGERNTRSFLRLSRAEALLDDDPFMEFDARIANFNIARRQNCRFLNADTDRNAEARAKNWLDLAQQGMGIQRAQDRNTSAAAQRDDPLMRKYDTTTAAMNDDDHAAITWKNLKANSMVRRKQYHYSRCRMAMCSCTCYEPVRVNSYRMVDG